MRACTAVMMCVLCLSTFAVCQHVAHQARPPVTSNPYVDPAWVLEDEQVFKLGDCNIVVTRAFFWRDWMPIVSSPGPDHGSPLRSKISFWVDNSKGKESHITLKAVAVDTKKQSYPLTISILPNYQLLPEDVAKAFRDYDEAAQKKAMGEYRVVWDNILYPGEARLVEVASSDGPYLPPGSEVRVDVTWTDATGKSVVVSTPLQFIMRTD
jgi:hypothetical protein